MFVLLPATQCAAMFDMCLNICTVETSVEWNNSGVTCMFGAALSASCDDVNGAGAA